jgi:hypothetical protein
MVFGMEKLVFKRPIDEQMLDAVRNRAKMLHIAYLQNISPFLLDPNRDDRPGHIMSAQQTLRALQEISPHEQGKNNLSNPHAWPKGFERPAHVHVFVRLDIEIGPVFREVSAKTWRTPLTFVEDFETFMSPLLVLHLREKLEL